MNSHRPHLPLLLLAIAAACAHPRTTPERFDHPEEAAAYYAMKRIAPPGQSPQSLYDAAREHIKRMSPGFVPRSDSVTPGDTVGSWTFLGPGNVGGRTRALLIDDRNRSTMYAAGVSGGIWKTTDAGAHWFPIGDVLANLDVSSLAFDPQNHDVVYAGTGEGYFREDVRGTELPLRGNGIFVTPNAGATWARLESTTGPDFYWVNDLAVSPHDSSRIYAATRTGVWRSGDFGASWSRVVPTTARGGCLDLAFRGDTANDFLFASCGVFEQATVYRTKDGEADAPWQAVLSEAGMSRTSLAIAPSNPSIVYALGASNRPGPQNTTQNLFALYRSNHDGDPGSWQVQTRYDDPEKLNTVLLTNAIAAIGPRCDGKDTDGEWVPMGWHCNVLAVDPTNPDRIWAAGVDLFRSEDGGKTWGEASYWWNGGANQQSWVHADQHVIVFDPGYNGTTNQTMFAANDGGIFRTDNANAAIVNGTFGACRGDNSSVAFTSLNNNYGVTQFYHGAVFPDGTRWFGGAQDNGTVAGTAHSGVNAWVGYWGGDGGFVGIDPFDSTTVYFESQNGELVRSSNNNTFDAAQSYRGKDSFLFITPFAIDRFTPGRLWIGGTKLWRSDDRAVTWTQASTTLNGQVSAIALGIQHRDRVLAGTSKGDIVRNENGWTAAHPRDGFVSSVTFDPNDDDIVYATYALFGGAHVWKSTDGGATWNSIDGDLPDIPMHSLAIDPTRPSHFYLGTDLGIFVSNDGGESWSAANTGFASVITEYVTIAPGERGPAVYAFTHGRGLWRAELVPGRHRRAVR